MGVGIQVLALYSTLKIYGIITGKERVVELGSQNVCCQSREQFHNLFSVFGRRLAEAELMRLMDAKTSSRQLYELLGFESYDCLDVDENCSIKLDLNFDGVPDFLRGKYSLTTNHGTAEHIINQLNVFKAIHDLTAKDGLILNAVPLIGYPDHGFFNYHPNFFSALAKYNNYEIFGAWVYPSGSTQVLSFNDFFQSDVNLSINHDLLVLMYKRGCAEFKIPMQGCYETMLPASAMSRYQRNG